MEWRFEEGTGKLSLPVEGTQAWRLEAVSWVDGRNGKALGFNGAEGKAVLSPADWRARAAADSFTLAAWIRLDKAGRIAPIFSRQTEAARGWVLMTSLEGRLKLEIASAAGKLRLSSHNPLPPGEWHHVAMTDPGSTRRALGILYIDGALVSRGTVAGAHEEPDLPVLLGRYRWSARFDHYLAGLGGHGSPGLPGAG
ncbi:MAG: LamG domain-containing protein [Kiritimatiellia bacterium]